MCGISMLNFDDFKINDDDEESIDVEDDGTEVKSTDVVSPEEPPSQYVVIEAPTPYHVTTLLAEPRLAPAQLENLKAVFHFSPPYVMRSKEYTEWMSRQVHFLYTTAKTPS